MKTKLILSIFFLAIGLKYNAQTKTNIDKILDAVETGILKSNVLKNESKSFPVSINVPPSLEIIKPKIGEIFTKRGFALSAENKTSVGEKIIFSLLSAKVDYSNMEKDGLLGDIKADRTISVKGTIEKFLDDGSHASFSTDNELRDTIGVEEIKKVEDSDLSFTQAPVPEIPFLTNLIEPVVVVGTLVVTVLLLFLVRSK